MSEDLIRELRLEDGDGVSLDALLRRAAACSTPTLYEAAGAAGALPMAIRPIDRSFRICGLALPVATPPGDNLWIHRAVAAGRPGDVIVIATGGYYEAGYWGEVLSRAAASQHIGGVVLDGCVRDGERLAEVGVPVFARGLCIMKTTKDHRCAGSVGRPVRVGSVLVETGDVVVGDGDGVVVLPRARVGEIVRLSEARDEAEVEIFRRIAAGESTMQIYGLE